MFDMMHPKEVEAIEKQEAHLKRVLERVKTEESKTVLIALEDLQVLVQEIEFLNRSVKEYQSLYEKEKDKPSSTPEQHQKMMEFIDKRLTRFEKTGKLEYLKDIFK